jgi:ankyrin repeat protein
MTMVFQRSRSSVNHREDERWRFAHGKAATRLMIVLGVVLLGLALADLFPFGNSELYRAIWDGDEARALQLIEAGANPNSTWGATHRIETENRAVYLNPLHFALARAQPRVAVALIEAGADPNSHDDDGNTALIVAANKNWTAVVRALLARGADPNAAGRDGETPLHNAPNGPGGHYPGFGKVPKSLTQEIREMLVKAGAK